MQNILITGANRGIGFELTRQFLQQGDSHIFAACRSPGTATQLNELAQKHSDNLTVLQMDINDEAAIDAAVKQIAVTAGALDVLINNAGVFPKGDHPTRDLGRLSKDHVSEVLTTNAVSPLIVTQACHHLLKKGKNSRVVMISSGLGSILAARGGSYAYRMSKAAMNMAARVLAYDDAMAGITTITTHPGWVQTDMGGSAADITPEQSASGLHTLISRLTLKPTTANSICTTAESWIGDREI